MAVKQMKGRRESVELKRIRLGKEVCVTSSLLCGGRRKLRITAFADSAAAAAAGGRPELMDPGQVKARQDLEDMTADITDRHS
jgi:hypothetical protein